MKKSVLILFLLLLFFNITNLPAEQVTGEVTGEIVTGKASNQGTAVSIVVLVTLPTITITNPENKTYTSNSTIQLTYSATNANTIKYNLNNTANTTITSSIYFRASEGLNTLYLYASNGQGTAVDTVIFTVNSTKFTIINTEFTGLYKGISTNFTNYAYEDLQNLSNITLENSNTGKIQFNEIINLTADSTPNDGILDIDTNINVSQNRIEINPTALPNFNKQATLTLYNLTFTNPRVLKDGAVCPSSICTEQSYSENTFVFNVTEFAVYSAEETPEEEVEEEIIPSLRVESGTALTKKFSIDKKEIQISLIQGETKQEEITIKNTGNIPIKINLEKSQISNFLEIDQTFFELGIGKSKTIILNFITKEDTPIDLYVGKLIIDVSGIKTEIPITIEVESKEALFDVSIKISPKFKQISPGEDLIANISLFDLGETGKVDTFVEYIIKDEKENIILTQNETITINKTINLVRAFELPKDIAPGEYVLYVKISYKNKTASASAWFSVKKRLFSDETMLIIIVSLISLTILLVALHRLKKKNKASKLKSI